MLLLLLLQLVLVLVLRVSLGPTASTLVLVRLLSSLTARLHHTQHWWNYSRPLGFFLFLLSLFFDTRPTKWAHGHE